VRKKSDDFVLWGGAAVHRCDKWRVFDTAFSR